ncbi:class I SAM-dependent methyltransferase [Rhizobium sp. R693]|uniref:class I SAM-dependent methyltransferase n=1 Tax=Rhizobium sp. R693 TaxID=1764276 RepID=UPI000B53436E|nr:class I SAM-dependent methyltransferase [Rhizobium sp. R693]OWV83235.1 methylase [Rhizobium sp. R693]
MEDIYISDQYAELNPTWHEEDSPWKADQIAKIIEKNGLTFSSLCEVGCGTGEILLNLARAYPNAKFDGYEVAPHAYQRARLKTTGNVSFHLQDILQVPDVHYDILVIADVIEHVEDYISFIKGLRALARYKIFHIPLDLSVQSVLRGWPITNLRKNVGHLHYFFKETALATVKDCGYSVVDYAYTASRIELPNQAFSSKLMSLPRKLLFPLNPDLAVRVLGGYSLLVLAE